MLETSQLPKGEKGKKKIQKGISVLKQTRRSLAPFWDKGWGQCGGREVALDEVVPRRAGKRSLLSPRRMGKMRRMGRIGMRAVGASLKLGLSQHLPVQAAQLFSHPWRQGSAIPADTPVGMLQKSCCQLVKHWGRSCGVTLCLSTTT